MGTLALAKVAPRSRGSADHGEPWHQITQAECRKNRAERVYVPISKAAEGADLTVQATQRTTKKPHAPKAKAREVHNQTRARRSSCAARKPHNKKQTQ